MKLGLWARRECWTLTFRGKLLIFGAVLSLVVLFREEGYPFLATSHRIDSDLLIVEGWIPENVVGQAAAEFTRGHYRQLLLVRHAYGSESQTQYVDGRSVQRDYQASLLFDYGIPRQSLGVLYYPAVERDRTYHAALATKEWLEAAGMLGRPFNVVTAGPHARRSWLMFLKTFGNTAEIGIVPLTDPEYDPKHWWRTSEGVREVLGETIAYVYAKFFFVSQ